ncbi:MAG: sulfotransferase [Saprospiraceae bacterium]|nr:sulfotransferase [Saprospiraceae bacterium]MCB9320606.1 sulfotransferase [Lewinellaceae bacterium]
MAIKYPLHQLEPLLVASPIQRSGTTLIQRLLSSAPNTLIYGESCAHDINLMLGLWIQKQGMFDHRSEWRNKQLEQVLAGDVDDWIPDLIPNTTAYLANFECLIADSIEFYARFARDHGRDRWGVKLPGWNAFQLENIMNLIPATKIIYIVRDIRDCICSAKNAFMCQDLDAIAEFISIWRTNLTQAKQKLKSCQVFWIAYDDLITHPEKVISELEQFSGASGINLDVLAHRINDYDRRHVPPVPLTAAESELIRDLLDRVPI